MASAPASITALRVTVFDDGNVKQAANSTATKTRGMTAVVISDIVNFSCLIVESNIASRQVRRVSPRPIDTTGEIFQIFFPKALYL
jgi:hypothetical protein